MLPELLDQIDPEQEIATVTADGAFDTLKCHNAIHCQAVHVYMHERVRPRCGRNHPATPERHAVEADHCRSQGPQRGALGLNISRPITVAALDRVSPTKSS